MPTLTDDSYTPRHKYIGERVKPKGDELKKLRAKKKLQRKAKKNGRK